jgi:hypothetical protein
VIGYNATGAGSNTATLGNTSITSTVLRGNVRHYGTASGYVGLQAPATVSTPYSLTLPTAAPASNGQVLSATTAGVMSWGTPATGTVTNVTGSAPIAVATGTSTPVISIAAATTSDAGSMSAADKTKLDGLSGGWGLTGNSGTTPGTNFIGTTDDKALVFKVNSQKAGQVGSSTNTNTSFGYQTLNANTTGTRNTANGYNALYSNNANSRSTAIGYNAMYYAEDISTGTKETFNTAVGYEALKGSETAANNTGQYNTAVGDQALAANTSGYSNTANGFESLFVNTSGNGNTANGFEALYSNTSGSSNTANGVFALYANTTGNYNTACGYDAGTFATSGENSHSNYSVYLGMLTKAFADGQNNEIVIGYNATGAGSNTVTLGNTDITTTVLRGDVTAKRYVLTQPSAITSAATTTIDLSLGNVFQVNLAANIGTLNVTNPVVGTYLIKLTQDATGGRTVAFPFYWKWSGGTAPIVTVTAAKTDIVTLIWDGGTFYATIVQNF